MILLYYLFLIKLIVYSFSPDISSFDAYGVKIAVNDIILVECFPSDFSFFLRFSPFNYSLSCKIPYNDSNQYIYTVSLQTEITYNDTIRFVFIGINIKTDIPFIGSLTYTGITGLNYINRIKLSKKSIFPCDGWKSNNYRIHQFEQFSNFDNDENNNNDFFVLTVSREGQFAYAFTRDYLIIYNLNEDIVSIQYGNITWPDRTFLPRAVDISHDLFFVIIGYIEDLNNNYIPCAYLMNISNSSFNVLDKWLYTPSTNTSWQAQLTNWDADVYATKYDMSVKINDNGDQVLFGIQIVNTIILIDINQMNKKFGLLSQSLSNGKSIGMGKSVNWLDKNLILVLVNTYSLSYVWSSSQVFIYNITIPNSFVVQSIFPNIQQTLAPTFGPILISIVRSENGTVVLLDSEGNYYIILPSPAGSFSDSSSGTNSSPLPCIAGTFNLKSSIFPCSLCPSGSSTNGQIGQSLCIPCKNDTFCSLGAAFGNINSSSSLLTNINEARAYPVSPQSTRFDNILIQNMFTIPSSLPHRCLVVSPIFWAIIVISFGLFIWIIMFIVKRYVKNPIGKKAEEYIERFLKKVDVIGDGEMVIGGLFSFAILVLVTFAYTFSSSYLDRYPIEKLNETVDVTCDQSLKNAQFSSGLMATGIPPNDDEMPIFALLDGQSFTLQIDFINTLFKCIDITVIQIKDINIPMVISSCYENDSSVSISLVLPSHTINLQVLFRGINTIGALRIGLLGSGTITKDETFNAMYNLLDLVFAQGLSISNRLLTQQPSCALQLTKIINRTYPLEDNDEIQFSATWLPVFSGSLDQMFVDEIEYKYITSSTTILSIVITETFYYVLNTQKPITDEDELIFTNLLFTIVCLEIFGLGFIIFKLIIIPLIKRLFNYFCQSTIAKKLNTNHFDQPHTLITRM